MHADRRISVARHLEGTLADAGRPFVARGPRYLIQPSVLEAARADLGAVLEVVADESRPVPSSALLELQSLLRDGASSPLYGRDPQAAAVAARRLRDRVAPVAEPKTVTRELVGTASR